MFIHIYSSFMTNVVSYYRFPESVSCTFEDSEIQAILRKTSRCPDPRTGYDICIIPCSIQAEYAKPNVTSYDKSPCGKKCGPNRGSSKKSQKEVKVSSSNGPKNVGHNLIGTNIAHCKSHIWREVVLICLCMFIVHMLHQIRVLKRLRWDSTPQMSL